jgi:hypothetical protein
MKELLPKLTARLRAFQEDAQQLHVPLYQLAVPKEETEVISHAWFWPRLGGFFKEKDVVVAETGTSSFGILDVPLPEGARFVSQILWGSIGWAVGAPSSVVFLSRVTKRDWGARKYSWRCISRERRWTWKDNFIHRGWKPVRPTQTVEATMTDAPMAQATDGPGTEHYVALQTETNHISPEQFWIYD